MKKKTKKSFNCKPTNKSNSLLTKEEWETFFKENLNEKKILDLLNSDKERYLFKQFKR